MIQIFENIDCMIGMEKYSDLLRSRKVLAIVDPPYGKNADKGTNGFGSSQNRKYKGRWDKITPDKEYFDELIFRTKDQIIFGGNYFLEKLTNTNCFIVWDKIGEYKFNNPFADVELAWTSLKSVAKKITVVQQGFINSNNEVIHPTQKPIKLYRKILEMYGSNYDLILDTHVGSASSLIACEEMGFDYIGFELDEQYYSDAKKRLEAARFKRECKAMDTAYVKDLSLFNQDENGK